MKIFLVPKMIDTLILISIKIYNSHLFIIFTINELFF